MRVGNRPVLLFTNVITGTGTDMKLRIFKVNSCQLKLRHVMAMETHHYNVSLLVFENYKSSSLGHSAEIKPGS